MNEIRNSLEDKKSRIAWHTINEVRKRKSISRVKLNATSQEERMHMWTEHFKNILGNSHKVIDKTPTKLFIAN